MNNNSSALAASLNVSAAGAWARYFARQLDILMLTLVCVLLTILFLVVFFPLLFLKINGANSILLYMLCLPVAHVLNACIISVFGNSLGKALFGIKAVPLVEGGKFSFLDNVRRELRVWIFGLAMGLPFILIVPMIRAFWRTSKGRATSYDEGRAQVQDFSGNTMRYTLGVLASTVVLLGFMQLSIIGGKSTEPMAWTNPETGQTVVIPARWTHQQLTGADDEPRYGFVSMKTGHAVALTRIAMPDSTLMEYTAFLEEKLSDEVTLDDWKPSHISNVLVASGFSGEEKDPITLYVAQKGSDFWDVIVMDSLHSGDQEIVETDIVRILFSSAGIE